MKLPEEICFYIANFLSCSEQLHFQWAFSLPEINSLTRQSVKRTVEKIEPFSQLHVPYHCMFPDCPHNRLFLFDLTDEDGPMYFVSLSWYCSEHDETGDFKLIS